MKQCCVCNIGIAEENPAVLTMGRFGNPRYLCVYCAERFDTVTLGRETAAIRDAMDRISEDLCRTGTDDEVVNETVSEIFENAAARASAIDAGEYDFSLDEVPEDEPEDSGEEDAADSVSEDEATDAGDADKAEDADADAETEGDVPEFDIPEELRESEEDKELDRRETEQEKKFDKILNIAWYVIGPLFVAALVYFLFFR